MMHLTQIFKDFPQYIYWKDTNLVYQGCNQHVADHLGLNAPDAIIGKTDHDFNWNETRINLLKKIDKIIINQGIEYVVEDVIPRIDDSAKTMLTCKRPLYDCHRKIIGIIGISIDMTDQKQHTQYLQEWADQLFKVVNHLLKISANAASKTDIDRLLITKQKIKLLSLANASLFSWLIEEDSIRINKSCKTQSRPFSLIRIDRNRLN